ncbi:MAG TPA: acyltransferase [Stellaceae bacterium]|nr:acyltransferase [Stellaceae bacterium]
MSSAPSPHLSAINGLRGIAILGVLFHHLARPSILDHTPPAWLPVVSPAVGGWWTGVNLFFLLSGFVLFLPYARGARGMREASDVGQFYRRRVIRLAPAFYVSVLATLAVFHQPTPEFWSQARQLLSWTYIFNPAIYQPPLNWALWSIGTEVLFSLAFPALVVLAMRFGALRLLLVILPVALAMRGFALAHETGFTGPTWLGDGLLIGRLDEFAYGMAIAELFAAGRMPARAGWMLGLSVALVAAAWLLFDLCFHHVLPAVAAAPVGNLLDLGLAGLLLAALMPGRWSRWLSLAPLQAIGIACYSIYLWHLPISNLVAAAGLGRGLVNALLTTAALAVVAPLSYRLLESSERLPWHVLPRAAAAGRLKIFTWAADSAPNRLSLRR